MSQALFFIIKSLTQLVLMVVLLRFWLPLLRADFRNPVAQGILRITAPLIVPIRRFVPAVGRIDSATLIVALVLECLAIMLLAMLLRGPFSGLAASPLPVLLTAVIDLAMISLNIFFFATLVSVILSWVAPAGYNPIVAFVNSVAEPVLRPFRRLIPPIGGLDISPVFALILLQAAGILLGTLKPLPI